MFPRKNLLIRR